MEDGIIHRSGITHSCIDVKGALRQTSPTKNPYLYWIVKQADFEGKKVIPMGECPNFDFNEGCPGHWHTTILHDWKWEEGNG